MRTLFIFFLLLNIGYSSQNIRADITKVTANSSTFSVTIKSDETGCAQYANWWEVLDSNGKLLYRRILFHSHPSEQPFTRSGSQLNISKSDTVYIRAHMNSVGYIGDVFKGSIDSGFQKVSNPPKFAKEIEFQKPQPGKCWF